MSVKAEPLSGTDSQAQDAPAPDSIWRVKGFWVPFLASITFELGGALHRLALPLILLAASASVFEVNAVRAVMFMPNVLFAFAIGAVVDSVPKRLLLITSLIGQALVLALLFFVFGEAAREWWMIYALAFVLSLFSYAYATGQTVIVKYVVPKPLITSAVAALSIATTTLYIAGPALSGIVLSLSDYRYGLLLACCALALTAVIVLPLAISSPRDPLTASRVFENLRIGWREFVANKPLRYISICVMVSNMAVGIFEINVIVLMREALGLSASAIGLLLSVAGAGAVAGSALAGRVRARIGLGHVLVATGTGATICYVALALSSNIPVLLGVLCLVGLTSAMFNVSVWSFRQETTPAHVMGAVAGITGSIFKLGMPFAILAAGWLVGISSIRSAFWGAALFACTFAAMVAFNPAVRRHQ